MSVVPLARVRVVVLAMTLAVVSAATCAGCIQPPPSAPRAPGRLPAEPPPPPLSPNDPCNVQSLSKSPIQGRRVPSPDGRRYLINKKDAKGTAQIYVGTTGSSALTCITCAQRPGGPKPE